MNHFATVITHDHVDHALTLHTSLEKFGESTLHVLIVNPRAARIGMLQKAVPNRVKIYTIEDLTKDDKLGILSRFIISKYSYMPSLPDNINGPDYMRWSFKSVFIQKLFATHDIPHILYCDCDLYFYGDYNFLYDHFKDNRIILSPHWRVIRPVLDNDYKFNYLHGLYNAGFVGFRNDATDMLEWWAEMCAIECRADDKENATYVDQKYLDLVPLYFDGTYIIRHKGCNVAAWNMRQLDREVKDGKIYVEGDDLVFIHYSPVTIEMITNGLDYCLAEPYRKFQHELRTQRLMLVRKNLPDCVSHHDTEENKSVI